MIIDTSALLAVLYQDEDIEIRAVTFEHAQIARQAYLDFGKSRHPAELNLGDCFTSALIRDTGEPLLYKVDNFGKTDIPGHEL